MVQRPSIRPCQGRDRRFESGRDRCCAISAAANSAAASGFGVTTRWADEIATALNTRPKYVASRTLDMVDWNNSFLIKGDVAEEVAKLKAQEGGEIFDSKAAAE